MAAAVKTKRDKPYREFDHGGGGPGGVTLSALTGLILLLLLPAWALICLSDSVDGRILAAIPMVLSTVSYFLYRSDKRSAEAGEWRIPESTLHAADFLGGWPGGFLAQRMFRHKISKGSFQFKFWVVVIIHEFLALDYLLHWKLTHWVLQLTSQLHR